MPSAAAAFGVRPRLGVALWRVGRQDSAAVAVAAVCGIDYLHVDLGGPGRGPDLTDPAHLAHLHRSIARRRMSVGALSINRINDIGLARANQENLSALFKASLKAALHLGAPRLVVPGFGKSLVQAPADFDVMARRLAILAERAGRFGLELAHEPSMGPEDSVRLVQAVGVPNFTLLFDTGNPAALGHDPSRIWTAIQRWASADAHLKDIAPRGGARAPLAGGRAGLGATLLAFSRRGWPRSLILEGDYRRNPVACLRGDLARLRSFLPQG